MKVGDKVRVTYPHFANSKIQLGSVGVITRVCWDGWLEVLFDDIKLNMTEKSVELIGVEV